MWSSLPRVNGDFHRSGVVKRVIDGGHGDGVDDLADGTTFSLLPDIVPALHGELVVVVQVRTEGALDLGVTAVHLHLVSAGNGVTDLLGDQLQVVQVLGKVVHGSILPQI